MPNWCDCELTIHGPHEVSHRFVEFAANGDRLLDEDKFIPYPEKFRKRDEARKKWEEDQKRNGGKTDWSKAPKDGFNSGGYEWCGANWGTKWGFCDVTLSGRYPPFYKFKTAWNPPSLLIKKMGEMFPELRFELEYFERGAEFCGTFTVDGGVVECDESREYRGERGG